MMEEFRDRTTDDIQNLHAKAEKLILDLTVLNNKQRSTQGDVTDIGDTLQSIRQWADNTSGAVANLEENDAHLLLLVRQIQADAQNATAIRGSHRSDRLLYVSTPVAGEDDDNTLSHSHACPCGTPSSGSSDISCPPSSAGVSLAEQLGNLLQATSDSDSVVNIVTSISEDTCLMGSIDR